MNKVRLTKWLAFLLLVFVISGCQVIPQAPLSSQGDVAPPAPTKESTFERVKREGFVQVGFANENPFAYARPDGTLTGQSVEVARTIFQNLGIAEMEGVLTEFGSLIPSLQAGRFDVITAGMYIQPKRCEQVLFANPEVKIGEALIVPQGNPLGLHSYEDIVANPESKIGTVAGYIVYDYMIELGASKDQIVIYPDDPSAMAGLQAGQVDAFGSTAPTMTTLLQTTNDPGFELATPFTDPVIDGKSVAGYAAAAFRHEDADFQEAFNAELLKLRESGELLTITSQYTGFSELTLPGDVTSSELCQP